MSNIMSQVKLKNNPSRDGYDYSRKLAYSAKVGELLPVECIEIIPGDTAEINVQHFTRTMPVNTPAYTRMREYYDWFFVPTNTLWSNFNSFVGQLTDNPSVAQSIKLNSELSSTHPHFTTYNIQDYLRKIKELEDGLDAHYSKNIFGYDRAYQSAKLLSYLGYGNYFHYAGVDSQPQNLEENVKLNPFPMLAYQKVYQDYYRNSSWESSYAPACNIDYINNNSNLLIDLDQADYKVENMMDLRYANWNKDYFMGLLPNSQYGDMASVDFSTISYNDTSDFSIYGRSNATDVRTQTDGRLSADGTTAWRLTPTGVERIAQAMGVTNEQLSRRFTILALRQAEASQKWKEITQSNRRDYPSQVHAHFGVRPSDSLSHLCQFIDGGVSQLDIDEVQNQNLADDNAVTLGGKGIGTGSANIKFESKVHGYLLCIYHCKPLLDFKIDGIKKRNLKTEVTDYAIPEFDKTGMVRVPMIELNFSKYNFVHTVPTESNFLLGYAPQYYEYKTQYDEVLGAFAHGSLSNWTAPMSREYLQNYFREQYSRLGSFDINYVFFKIPPSVVNPIFVGQVTPEYNDLDTDQLLINCAFDMKLVRNLDRNGLPY